VNRALTVAFREVKSYLQDRADLAFSLLLPVAIFAIMYGAFGGQTQFHGTVNIVNDDEGGVYSSRLLKRLGTNDSVAVNLLTRSSADAKLEASSIVLALYIPADFSTRLAAGQPAQIVFKQRGNGGTEGQIVASIVRGTADALNRDFAVEANVKSLVGTKGIPNERIEVAVQRYLEREGEAPLVRVVETAVGGNADPINQFLPGIITMFVLFAITLSAQVIVEERRKGTLERLMTTRLKAGELFAGKFLSGMVRAFLQTFLLLALSYIVFRLFTPLTFFETLVIALVFAAAASAFGLLIASIARTPDQAVWTSVAFTMVWTTLGGTFFRADPGSLFDTLGKFSLNTYANNAFVAIISEGRHLTSVGKEIGIILAVAVVALVLSRLVFRAVVGGK
jgi:ABC-2 type transport system permease protein